VRRATVAGWLEAARVYRDRRVLSLFFLGVSSGLPFGVMAEPLSARLVDAGLSKTAIGLFAFVSVPYALKFLWAPIMDHVAPPWPARALGRRRGWAVVAQAALFVAMFALGAVDPARAPLVLGTLALFVAFASASQDIVVDAYRVEILDERRYAAGAATAVFGWRVGQLGSAVSGLVLADLLPWPTVFAIVAAGIGVGFVAVLVNPEPAPPPSTPLAPRPALARLALRRPDLARALAAVHQAAVAPLADFTRRPDWIAVLALILLYKFGDAVLAVMKVPFFLELGFSNTEIAEVAKLFGTAATIAGGLVGGVVLARLGILRGLLVCGVLMAVSNLIFVAQAWAGRDLWMLALTIAVENVTTGMGTTAFVAYLSSLCNVAYTATQYALLTSLMAFSRTVMSSGAGWLADKVDWAAFFVLTTLAAVPGLVLLVWMMRRYPPRAAESPQFS
jgi:PAT family beta-lactamase induction signal transducer AmpG